ncbi:hypothetical protein HK405_013472, partial [Cladochytrium tenue]
MAEFVKEIASAYDGVSVVAERDVDESALFVDGSVIGLMDCRFTCACRQMSQCQIVVDLYGNQLLGPGLATVSAAPPVAEDARAIGIDAFFACGRTSSPPSLTSPGRSLLCRQLLFVYRYRVAQAVPADLAALRRAPTPTKSEREACIVYYWIEATKSRPNKAPSPMQQSTSARKSTAAEFASLRVTSRTISVLLSVPHRRQQPWVFSPTRIVSTSGVDRRGFSPVVTATGLVATAPVSTPASPLVSWPSVAPGFPGPARLLCRVRHIRWRPPPRFAAGRPVVRRGASPYSSAAAVTSSAATAAAPALFHVFGTAPAAVRASEAPCRAASLSGGAFFVARLNSSGSAAALSNSNVAVAFRLSDGDPVIEIRENAEPRVFWQKVQASGSGGGG